MSIESVLSKVHAVLVSVRLGRFIERSGVHPTPLFFLYRKSVGICVELLCMSHTLQSALGSGQEARIVQIDIIVAGYRINHPRILYKLCVGNRVICIVYIDKVSFNLITARYDRWTVVRVNSLTLCHDYYYY